MASFGRPRLPVPPVRVTYSRDNFNMNPGVTRPPPQFFQQQPPNPFSSFSGSDTSATHGTFISRPRFPGFGETGFQNRPPVSESFTPSNLGPPFRTQDMNPSFMPPNIPQPVRSPGIGPALRHQNMDPTIRPPNMDLTIRPPNMDLTIRPPNMGPTIRPPNIDLTIRPPNMGPTMRPPNMGPTMRPPNMDPTIRPPNMGPIIRPPIMGPIMRPPNMDPTTSMGPPIRPSMGGATPGSSDMGLAGGFQSAGPSSVLPNMDSEITYPDRGSVSCYQNIGQSIRTPKMAGPVRPRHPGPSFECQVTPWHQQPPPFNPRPQFHNRPRSPFPSSMGRELNFNKAKNKKRKTQKFKDKGERKLKDRDDGTEKPFSCDTCDRAFLSEDELIGHLSQHIKCDYPDCKFEAHPKIVILHKKMQHDTGYAEIISNLNTNQEIEKWREERRNRFPTAENILKRKAEQAEKEARGEVLETKEFGKFKRRRLERKGMKSKNHQVQFKKGRFGQRTFQHRKHNNFVESSNSGKVENVSGSESDSDSDSHITLKGFSGLSSLMECSELINCTNENNLASKTVNTKNCTIQKSINEVRTNLNTDSEESNQDQYHVDDVKRNEYKNGVLPVKSNTVSHFVDGHLKTKCITIKEEISNYELNDELHKTECITIDDNFSPSFSPRSASSVELLSENSVTEFSPKTMHYGTKKNPIFIESGTFEYSNARTHHCEYSKTSTFSKSMTTSKAISQRAEDEPVMNGSKDNPIDIEDSDEEAPLEIPILKSEPSEMYSENLLNSDDETPEVLPILKAPVGKTPLEKNIAMEHDYSINQGDKAQKSRRKSINSGKKSYEHSNCKARQNRDLPPRNKSLLEKLLAPDIRHERNVILQCVRYIVENNYFGIGSNKP